MRPENGSHAGELLPNHGGVFGDGGGTLGKQQRAVPELLEARVGSERLSGPKSGDRVGRQGPYGETSLAVRLEVDQVEVPVVVADRVAVWGQVLRVDGIDMQENQPGRVGRGTLRFAVNQPVVVVVHVEMRPENGSHVGELLQKCETKEQTPGQYERMPYVRIHHDKNRTGKT